MIFHQNEIGCNCRFCFSCTAFLEIISFPCGGVISTQKVTLAHSSTALFQLAKLELKKKKN